MMKQEFDKLAGVTTALEAYERIEFVYMNSDKFGNKQAIVEFYKEKDMNGIEKEYKDILHKRYRAEEFKDFLFDLAYFTRDLNNHIKDYIAKNMHDIYSNITTVALLKQYRIRSEEELQQSVRDFEWCTRNEDATPMWSNHCLTNAKSFRDVLEHLIYREWWSDHAKEFD